MTESPLPYREDPPKALRVLLEAQQSRLLLSGHQVQLRDQIERGPHFISQDNRSYSQGNVVSVE